MSDTPPPNLIDKKAISRIGIIGAILGIFTIGLFIILWSVLGNIGMSNFPRIVASVCVPPTILAFLFGIYFITTRRSN
ncbi:MAG: hypothetical protein MUE54_02070 [Anaerolineae bacterium]|jgi:hypothetical protein|nr:hypothetical protein [Anaerolineae bacterium]